MAVEPIRNKKKIKEMYEHLLDDSDRNALMFKLGINTILRVSDLIKLKVSNVYNPEMKPREHLRIKEKKTGKLTKIKLHPDVLNLLIDYIKHWDLEYDNWLFFSYNTPSQHIDRTVAYKIINRAGKDIGLVNIGTESMRKTTAYNVYKKTKDIYKVMRMLNHKSTQFTKRYIGVT